MNLEAGLHYNVPMETYIADPCLLPSLSTGVMVDLIQRSPAHAWWGHPRLNPAYESDESSRADIGSAIHAAILGGKELVYLDFDDWRKGEARKLRDEARSAGKLALLQKDKTNIDAARKSARAMLKTLYGWKDDTGINTEGTMLWFADGTWKRGRFDIFVPNLNLLIDVKTTVNANPLRWIKSTLSSAGYDIQAEHYLDGARACGIGNDATQFLFLLVEIEPPFSAAFVGLDPAYSDFAKRKIAHATQLWKDCLRTDRWPGYSTAPHWAELAPWHEAELEMTMAYAKEAA